MVTLTERAASEVTALLEQQNKQDHSLRVWIAGGGCSGFQYGMALDNQPEADDQAFESNGVKLLVDPQSLQYLDGSEIDYVDTVMGAGFKVNNPNAPSCGGCHGEEGDEAGCHSGGCSGCASEQ